MGFFANPIPNIREPPPVEVLSPDLQYQLWERQQHRKNRGQLIALIVASPAILILAVPPLNSLAENALRAGAFPIRVKRQATVSPSQLFTSREALGACAIGNAEGTMDDGCQPTTLHALHSDPANQRPNSGWCSDQGRAGGDPALADKKCLQRARDRMPLHLKDLRDANIDESDLEAVINTADLYNQASPPHSRLFPKLLAQERLKRGKTLAAVAHARTRSFGEDASAADGLIGICRQEQRPVSDYDCVYDDQLRRVKEIDGILKTHPDTQSTTNALSPSSSTIYFPIPGQTYETATLNSGFGQRTFNGEADFHFGLDFDGAVGTPLLATEAGTVSAITRDGTPGNNGCGNGVLYTIGNGDEITYCHLETVIVRAGQPLTAGQQVGTLGSTGRSTGPHLHFEQNRPGELPHDPTDYLRRARSTEAWQR